MPKILQLDPHVADLIAAGEVVERPGSVIKELMENSIDAGATVLTVEIKNGGMTYMRVSDNGCGISPEDAGVAFLRHATSKLRDERGLEAIGTLGFRGEALAAISSVSRMEMLTREKNTAEGTRVYVDGGEITEVMPTGCPEGTTMTVRDLFFNTPARLKFMKSDKAEGANVTSAVLRIALSHPEISIKYIKDGKEEFHTPGDGVVNSCVYSLLGREFAVNLLEVNMQSNGITVEGYISAPQAARGNRNGQFFFVNGRIVKSGTLQAALEQAFKNKMFVGRFPACVLYISQSLGAVDVNVHPAKTEVRFLREKEVFDAVYYAVLGALEREEKSPELVIPTKLTDKKPETKQVSAAVLPKVQAQPKTGFYRSMSSDEFKEASKGFDVGFKTKIPPVKETRTSVSVHDSMKNMTSEIYNSGVIKYTPPKPAAVEQQILQVPKTETPELDSSKLVENEQTTVIKHEETAVPYRIIGEGLGTYIIVEQGSSLFLIDKHAAHERIIFDKLKSENKSVMSQILLQPEVCRLTGEEIQLICDNLSLLSKLGFDVEEFGNDSVIVRQVPADMDGGEACSLLEEIADKLSVSGRMNSESPEDRILHSVACKAAIKAGRLSEKSELTGLVKSVMNGEVRYCPHGRPVMIELTKSTIDKNFKRS